VYAFRALPTTAQDVANFVPFLHLSHFEGDCPNLITMSDVGTKVDRSLRAKYDDMYDTQYLSVADRRTNRLTELR